MARVVESAILDVPVEEAWRWLRDFNSHRLWHPAIAASRIEDDAPPDGVGAVRTFSLRSGGELREQLLRLDDEARELSYCLIDSPIPLHDYVATIRLRPVTDDGRTFWQWESEFAPPPERRRELCALVAEDIYKAGMKALERFIRENAVVKIGRDHAEPKPGDRGMPQPTPPAHHDRDLSGRDTGTGPSLPARAIMMDRYGGPEVLVERQVTVPPPGTGEVRIRQSHVGVNFIDVYCRSGYFNLVTPPGIPGMEAAGEVESVGAGVTHLRAGDRVAYACAPTGSYASLRTMKADLVVRLPDRLTNRQAAAGLLKGVTAGFLLHDVHAVRAGETVVVHAAAGGAGSLLTQWASSLGAHVIATVSSPAKAEVAWANGAREVVIGRGAAFVERVLELTGGEGADVIYDAVGRDSFRASLDALAIRGHLVSYGQASGDIGAVEIGPLASKSVTLSRPNYGHFTRDRAMMQMQAERLFEAVGSGRITIAEPTVRSLGEAARVHAELESGATTGAIVLAT